MAPVVLNLSKSHFSLRQLVKKAFSHCPRGSLFIGEHFPNFQEQLAHNVGIQVVMRVVTRAETLPLVLILQRATHNLRHESRHVARSVHHE